MRGDELAAFAARIRAGILARTPADAPSHVGSALSLVEILAAIYGTAVDIDRIAAAATIRDTVILSKGHGALAQYVALVEAGALRADQIDDYGPGAEAAPVHPLPGLLRGVDVATGSLGHGLAIGAGIALAHRLRRADARVIVILGDGECQEGSVWEAAAFAGHRGLDRLTVVVDANGLQQTGAVAHIGGDPSVDRWRSFGWTAEEVDGHDAVEVAAVLARKPEGRPMAIIGRTVKGRGLPSIEGRGGWHYRAPGAISEAGPVA